MANARANTGGLKIGLVRLGPYLLLGFLAMMVLLPIAPHLQVTPSTDSSVFLYIGQRILKGDVPYLDVWDHKGPLVYYIDAVGLGLTGGSRWGVWLLEIVFVAGAAWVGFKLLKQALGTWPALFGMVLLTLQLQLVIDGGNLTEEYSLLFQFSTLWFFWKALHDKGTMQYIFAGAAAGFCFLLRPNNIGVGLAIALYLTWLAISARKADGWKPLAALVAGGLIVLAPAALYFWAAGALPALWDQVFNFNLAYGAEGAGHRWEALVAGMRDLPILATFGLAGWVLAAGSLRHKTPIPGEVRSLTWVILIGLFVEMALTAMAGRSFPHYYMDWLPILGSLSAIFIFYVALNFAAVSKGGLEAGRLVGLMTGGLLFGFAILPIHDLLPILTNSLQTAWQAGGLPPVTLQGNRYEPVLDYVFKYVPEDEGLLVLGNEAMVNWMTGRKAPTVYVYQTPLIEAGYRSGEKTRQVIDELEANPPVIIDTGSGHGFLPSLGIALEEVPQEVYPLYQYFQEHYVYAGTFKPTDWDLYLYHGQGVPLDQ